jgi:hypothetical protein
MVCKPCVWFISLVYALIDANYLLSLLGKGSNIITKLSFSFVMLNDTEWYLYTYRIMPVNKIYFHFMFALMNYYKIKK